MEIKKYSNFEIRKIVESITRKQLEKHGVQEVESDKSTSVICTHQLQSDILGKKYLLCNHDKCHIQIFKKESIIPYQEAECILILDNIMKSLNINYILEVHHTAICDFIFTICGIEKFQFSQVGNILAVCNSWPQVQEILEKDCKLVANQIDLLKKYMDIKPGKIVNVVKSILKIYDKNPIDEDPEFCKNLIEIEKLDQFITTFGIQDNVVFSLAREHYYPGIWFEGIIENEVGNIGIGGKSTINEKTQVEFCLNLLLLMKRFNMDKQVFKNQIHISSNIADSLEIIKLANSFWKNNITTTYSINFKEKDKVIEKCQKKSILYSCFIEKATSKEWMKLKSSKIDLRPPEIHWNFILTNLETGDEIVFVNEFDLIIHIRKTFGFGIKKLF